jgi:hypothetical protein
LWDTRKGRELCSYYTQQNNTAVWNFKRIRYKWGDEYGAKLVNPSNTKVFEEKQRVPGAHKEPYISN